MSDGEPDRTARMRNTTGKESFQLSQRKGYTAAQIAEECNSEESEVKEILA